MSYASEIIYNHLTDPDDVQRLCDSGFASDEVLGIIPSEAGRKIVGWACRYYLDTGRRQAPTDAAIKEQWGDLIEAEEIDLGEGEQDDDIVWIIEQLRANHARKLGADLIKNAAVLNAGADSVDQVAAIGEITAQFNKLHWQLQPRERAQTSREGMDIALQSYIARQKAPSAMHGMQFGLPLLDEYLLGVHPGELCTWAGVTGGGKSWMADRTLWTEFEAGRTSVLFTLENDLETTFDRVVCMSAAVDYERWQRGCCTDQEMGRFFKAYDKVMAEGAPPFHVEMPPRGERTVHAMVRKALSLGAHNIIIDQLTFVEPVGKYTKQSDEIKEIMHDLKELISTGIVKLSCMLLHQVNRDGVAYARKNGLILPEHMSYGAEVERTSDMLIPIYQSDMMERIEEAEFQLAKFRRGKKARFAVTYRLGMGDIRIRHMIDEDNPDAEEVMAA